MEQSEFQSLLKLLSEKQRLQIIQTLLVTGSPMTPSLIAAKLKISQDLATHHLTTLKESDLVLMVPSGVNHFYAPNKQLLKELLSFLHKSIGVYL